MKHWRIGNPNLRLLLVCVLTLVVSTSVTWFNPVFAVDCSHSIPWTDITSPGIDFSSTSSVPLGTQITVTGTCWPTADGDAIVTWQISGGTLNTITVPTSAWTTQNIGNNQVYGSWSVPITVPAAPSGTSLTINTYQGSVGDQATGTSQEFDLYISGTASSATPSFTAAFPDGSSSGQPGDSLTVSGTNWDPNQQITIDFGSLYHSLTLVPGKVGEISSTGSFQQSVQIPSDATPGDYTVTVTQGSIAQTATITIVPLAPASQPTATTQVCSSWSPTDLYPDYPAPFNPVAMLTPAGTSSDPVISGQTADLNLNCIDPRDGPVEVYVQVYNTTEPSLGHGFYVSTPDPSTWTLDPNGWGSFDVTFTVPAITPPGNSFQIFVDSHDNSGHVSKGPWTYYVALSLHPHFVAYFEGSGLSGQPGQYLVVWGEGYDPLKPITISFAGGALGVPDQTLEPGTNQVNDLGQFYTGALIPVPSVGQVGIVPGDYVITVTQDGISQTTTIHITGYVIVSGSASSYSVFFFSVPPPTTQIGPPPTTSGDYTTILVVAAAILAFALGYFARALRGRTSPPPSPAPT